MTFDDVLPTVLRECEAWSTSAAPRTVAVVRDLRGHVRLAVDADASAKVANLIERLKTALGAWFSGEVLCTESGAQPLRGVARKVIELAKPWDDAVYTDALGGVIPVPAGRYRLLERRMGKHPWLEGQAEPPWEVAEGAPTVVAFYSFKGGVGRTTTLASCALQAARDGESVVVIDLDLEAPGLGSLFGVEADKGVIDLMVEHLATDAVELGDASTARLPGEYPGTVEVISAGRLDDRYLEKLSRLDFSGSQSDGGVDETPVRAALEAILSRVKEERAPRWIFLDARAGLHDLAGLSLHGLAHVDVLFSRANAQGYAGLDVVLRALSRRDRTVGSRVVLVHAMAPAAEGEAETERAALRERSHEMFVRHGLYAEGKVPEQAAEDADHRPWSVHRNERIERNDDLAVLAPLLASEDFRAIWERVKLLTEGGT